MLQRGPSKLPFAALASPATVVGQLCGRSTISLRLRQGLLGGTKRQFAAIAPMSGCCGFVILQFELHTIRTFSRVKPLIGWGCWLDPPYARPAFRSQPHYKSGSLSERHLENAAFTVFLFGRMIGAGAEIDDHLNRGRNMDTRTPASDCHFVV